jgi:Mrp family chromosome partitioning ATPase/uncharacterized protein involved in exopolysaccharide biosynthesis
MPLPENLRLDPAADTGPFARLPVPAAPSANGTPAPPAPTSRPAPPPALTRAVPVRDLLPALRRQWVLALSAALAAGVVVGCAVYAALPPANYTARASLQVSAAPPVVAAAPEAPSDFDTLKGTIQARVKSRAVLDAVLDQPDVKELGLLAPRRDPYEFLQGELAVDWSPGSEILGIRLSGERPKELAVLVSAVADAAVRDVNAREALVGKYRMEQLEKIHKDYEQSLDPRRKHLEELSRGAGPSQRTLLTAVALDSRQTELLRVRGELQTAEALLKLPSDPAPPAESKVAFDEEMKNDPDLAPLLAQIADLNGQVARYTALYKDNPGRARDVIKDKGLQARIDALYAQARQQHEKKVRASGAKAGPDAARGGADGKEELKARIASYKATEGTLSREIENLESDLRGLEVRAAEIDAIKREIAVRDEVSKSVATVLEKLRLEAVAPARAVRLDEATVSAGRDERLKLAALGGLGGAALALFGVAFLDARRRKLHTVADVTRGLELPVAGTQPMLSAVLNPLDPRHAAARQAEPWYARLNDSLDATRALLLRSAPPTAGRVVAVVSAVGGEGASVLAVQLAASLARAGRRTLLLDANLRRPAVHRAFGLAAGPGYAEVLRGETVLPAAVRPAPAERLWVMPAGEADLRALQGLSRERVQEVLDRLKRDYEYVVIDNAPVLPCADSLLLAQRADAVLVSVLAGASAVPTVHAAWQRLSALGVRLLGVVAQGTDDGMTQPRY